MNAARRARVVHWLASPVGVFSVGLLLRLAFILAAGFYEHPDTWENGEIATNIWNGHGFSGSLGFPIAPTSTQGPIYPYLMVAVWRVFGQGPAGYLFLSVLQAVAVSSMVFPIDALTRRWFGGVPATLAMWASVVSPIYLWFPARIHHTALILGVHPWLVLGWLKVAQGREGARPWPRWRLAAGTGGLTGVAALAQPLLLPTYGLLSGVLLARRLVQRRSAEAAAVLVAGMVTLVLIAPWTIRNYEVQGRLVPVKDGFGKELWMGNNPHATGTSFAEGGKLEITIAHPPPALALQGHASEIEVLDAFQAEAMEYIRAHPVGFLVRTAKKIAWFWTEAPRNVARSYGAATPYVRAAHFGPWLLFLALFFLAVATRRPSWEYLGVVSVFVLVYSLVYGLTHVGQPRQRGEIEFIFLPGVGAGAAWLLARFLPGAYAALAREAAPGPAGPPAC